MYMLATSYDAFSTNWAKVQPISSSGAIGGEDFDLDASNVSGTLSLRLRRTGGGYSLTAYVVIRQEGLNTDAFTPSSSTGSGSAPTYVQNGFSWSVAGNYGTTNGTEFIGTIDDKEFLTKINNVQAGLLTRANQETFLGYEAGVSNTNTAGTSFFGYQAGKAQTSGASNTALGYQALTANTTAGQNTAVGHQALYTQSYNSAAVANNVAVGYRSMYLNQPTSTSNGYQNSALGSYSLYSNTTGSQNTALGYYSLYNNTTATGNTSVGYQAGDSYANSTDNTCRIIHEFDGHRRNCKYYRK
jgi:hypothetical protein